MRSTIMTTLVSFFAISAMPAVANASEFDGVWRSGNDLVTLAGDQITLDRSIWEGSLGEAYHLTYRWTFTTAPADVWGVNPIDLSLVSVTATVFSQFDLDLFNSDRKCESTDWVLSLPKDITGIPTQSNCSEGDANPLYNLIEVVGDNLYLGDVTFVNDGTTPAKRPVRIDRSLPYVKQ